MKQTRGRELPGTFNPMIVGELFLEQSRPWEEITQQHISRIWEAVKGFLHLVIEHICDEATSAILFDEVISPALETLWCSLEARSRELLSPHQNGHPITYIHSFMEALQETRINRQKDRFAQEIRDFFQADSLESRSYISNHYCLGDLLQSLMTINEEDMVHTASAEALDYMLAYYQVNRNITHCANKHY